MADGPAAPESASRRYPGFRSGLSGDVVREANDEGRALTFLAQDLELGAVEFKIFSDQRESKTDAFEPAREAGVLLRESVEDMRKVGGVDSHAGVAHLKA